MASALAGLASSFLASELGRKVTGAVTDLAARGVSTAVGKIGDLLDGKMPKSKNKKTEDAEGED
jgi:hypothetical protein